MRYFATVVLFRRSQKEATNSTIKSSTVNLKWKNSRTQGKNTF